jgi:hypothetical protein
VRDAHGSRLAAATHWRSCLMRRILALVLFAGTAACGGGTTTPPSTMPPATPTPPAATPTPAANPFAAACGSPLPSFADSYGFGVKVQLEPSRSRKVINASPQVRNATYCQQAGIGGITCNTRFEDNPERVPCDHFLSGISLSGRPGPNWFKEVNGTRLRCGGQGVAAETDSCNLKDSNQYLLDVMHPGKYVACGGTGSPGTCGHCILDDDDFGVIHNSPAGLCRIEGFLQ